MLPKDPFTEVAFFGLIFWAIAIIWIFTLNGCAATTVAPNLTLPEKECPRLAMPAIPDQVHLSIEGDKLKADDGGDTLLRGYVRARQLLQ